MKRLSLVILASALTAAAASSALAAVMGPGGTGGGNAYGSKPEQVADSVKSTGMSLAFFLKQPVNKTGWILNPASVTDPDIKSVLEAWNAKNNYSDVIADIQASVRTVQAAPCQGDANEGETDASTEFHRNAAICFSSDRLTRFPSWTLDAEIFALLAHEEAHHFGFGEKEAQAIQGYILKNYVALDVQLDLRLHIESFADILKWADESKISDNNAYWPQEVSRRCMRVYHLLGDADSHFAFNNDDEYSTARMDVEFACGYTKTPNRKRAQLILDKLKAMDAAFIKRIQE